MLQSRVFQFRVLACVREPSVVRVLKRAAATLEKFDLLVAHTPADARKLLGDAIFRLVIVDLSLDPLAELVRDFRASHPRMSLLVVTDAQLRDHDRAAMKAGVDGFLVQPLRVDHAAFQMAHAREVHYLREERQRQLETQHGLSFPDFIGTSDEIRQVFYLISRAAASSVPVAIYGESGTGKERVGMAIHRDSSRKEGPFIAVNPSSIPESLIESELFGHARGAFTGAAGERIGYIEAANGGTLFLDEIGDLPLSVQGKVLRVLQEKTLQRVGSTGSARVDFRLISATHRDLIAEVRAGRFRQDLFYRIHVFPIYLPPLRARRSDIPLLAEHFLRKYSKEMSRPLGGFAPGVLEALTLHSWPGNVRELENVIYRTVAMKRPGEVIELADLTGLVEGAPQVAPGAPPTGSSPKVLPLAEHTTEYVRWAYEQLGRNKARVARMLEIDRGTLYRKLRGSKTGR